MYSILNNLKSEIYKKVLENKGVLYVNAENNHIQKIKFPSDLNVVRYGNGAHSDVSYAIEKIQDGYTHFSCSYK